MRTRLQRAHHTLTDARSALEHDPDNATFRAHVRRAETAVAENRALYDSTPGGQRELREQIDREQDAAARTGLQQRLTAGEELRARQIAALRHNQLNQTHEDGTDEQRADTDTGAARSVLGPAGGLDTSDAGARAASDRTEVERRGDQAVGVPRLLINHRELIATATHSLPGDRAQYLRAQGYSTPNLYELSPADADLYHAQMSALKDNNPYAASVYVYDIDEYRHMRLLVTDDGKAGVALKGDEVVSVYAHRDCRHPRAGRALLETAVAQGGRRLDCFDTVLPDLYSKAGFVAVARLRWNDDYAPDGWDYTTFRQFNAGRPDVVFMAYHPHTVDSTYRPGTGIYVDDYDQGVHAARTHSDSGQ
ncbi:hypothetical protein [Rhodococcus opacus]|nr:hypothetical protein [Rhodococcus opacus]